MKNELTNDQRRALALVARRPGYSADSLPTRRMRRAVSELLDLGLLELCAGGLYTV
jgi:hypothetical protein